MLDPGPSRPPQRLYKVRLCLWNSNSSSNTYWFLHVRATFPASGRCGELSFPECSLIIFYPLTCLSTKGCTSPPSAKYRGFSNEGKSWPIANTFSDNSHSTLFCSWRMHKKAAWPSREGLLKLTQIYWTWTTSQFESKGRFPRGNRMIQSLNRFFNLIFSDCQVAD